MRLISEGDAAKLAKDPKAEGVKTFYVEKCKGNSIPKHFMAEENKDKKTIKIDGVETTVARNKERSEYCAFCTGTADSAQCFYVRDHEFLDHAKSYVTYVKPVKEKPPKKEKAPKAEKPAKADKAAAKGGKSSSATEKAARDASADGDTGAA